MELHEACGVFGVLAKEPCVKIAEVIYHGLIGLQHRGQESAGMIISDGTTMKEIKGMGLVSHIMTDEMMDRLSGGKLGIGHTRYSTQGASDLANCQPISTETFRGRIALAHNGQLINKDHLRNQLLSQDIKLTTESDSEIILKILAAIMLKYSNYDPESADWMKVIEEFMNQSVLSYSFIMMTRDRLYGVRDPYGNRPLCIGRFHAEGDTTRTMGWILSSESSPFLSISAKLWREVQPGEIVCLHLSDNGDENLISHPNQNCTNKLASCLFEYVYFSRSDTILENQMVYSVRFRCGQLLAIKAPVYNADLVSCIPNSSTPAALGYSIQSTIPYVQVLIRNTYVGRTFIQPNHQTRQSSIKRKFGLLTENILGKKIILIDDSIVRGNTIIPLIQALKSAGAKEIHIRVASPPVRHPCFMGIDIPTQDELIANKVASLTQLAKKLDADSVEYLSYQDLLLAVQNGIGDNSHRRGYCSACFTGEYPVSLDW